MKFKNPLNLDKSIHYLLWYEMEIESNFQEQSLESWASVCRDSKAHIVLGNLGLGVIPSEDRENTHTLRTKKTVAVVNSSQTIYRFNYVNLIVNNFHFKTPFPPPPSLQWIGATFTE